MSQHVVGNTFLECWAKPTGLFVFSDEVCHLSWLYSVQHGGIARFDDVQTLPDVDLRGAPSTDAFGAATVVLQSGFRALFHSCSFGADRNFSFVNAVVAYHLDRLLHLHRTPATAVRHILWDDVLQTSPSKPVLNKLDALRARCHSGGKVLSGAMVGYTKHELRPTPPGILTQWFNNERFSASKPTQRLLEFAKLAVALLMFDLPLKLTHGPVMEMFVPHVVHNRPSRFVGTYFYVYVDNDAASFADPLHVLTPKTPVCDRAKSSTFACNVTWPSRHIDERRQSAELRGVLLSFLDSACVFPRQIAEQLLHFGSLDVHHAFSLRRELFKALQTAGLGERVPSLDGIDDRLRRVFGALVACVKRFGADKVLIAEDFYSVLAEPPRVHYDPAGHRYTLNANTGRWVKDETVRSEDNARQAVLKLARDELLRSKKLGLLQPSVAELDTLHDLVAKLRHQVDKTGKDKHKHDDANEPTEAFVALPAAPTLAPTPRPPVKLAPLDPANDYQRLFGS